MRVAWLVLVAVMHGCGGPSATTDFTDSAI